MRNARGQQGEASRVKMSGSEKKNTCDHEHEQQNFWWAHTAIPPLVVQNGIAVVQNNGKELYKKGGLHVQICFFANRAIDFVAVLVTVAVQHCTILFYFVFIIKYLVNESFDFSPG